MSYTAALASSVINVNISAPGTTMDGVTLSTAPSPRRVLLTRQTAPSQNGIWIWNGAGTAMSRPGGTDPFANGATFDNATLVWVQEGTARAGTLWGIERALDVTIDSTDLPLTQVSIPAVRARWATTENIDLASTVTVIDPRIVPDGMMDTSAPTALECPTTQPFTTDDVGKAIVVLGAGTLGADLVTTIAAYVDPSRVTLSTGCATSVSTRVTDGDMTIATKILTCVGSAPFTPVTDNGRLIVVDGAGVGGAPLVTQIYEVLATDTATLFATCETTVAPAVVRIGAATTKYSAPLNGDGTAGSDIVLVKDQTTRSENGIYWANTSGVMAHTGEPPIPGRVVLVSEGYRNAHTRHELVNQGAVVHEVTPINFSPQNLVFNVRDFGAIGDGIADDLPAFEAAFKAMGSAAVSAGAVLELPAGTYYLSENLRVRRQCIIRGWSPGGSEGATLLKFEAGFGVVFDAYNTSGPGYGRSDYSILERVDIISNWLTLEPRPEEVTPTLGMLIYAEQENRYYFKCVLSVGPTNALPPPEFTLTTVLTIGALIDDNGNKWEVCVHNAIFMRTRARVRDVSINFFTNAGILIAAPARIDDPINPYTGAINVNDNEWHLDHVLVGNCGVGVMVCGGETQVGTALAVSVQEIGRNFPDSTGGYGFYDLSQFGNTWIGCHVSGATGAPYYTEAALTCSVFLGCYSELDCLVQAKINSLSIIIGGAHGNVFDFDSRGLILSPGNTRNVHFVDELNKTSGGLDHFSGPEVMWFSSTDDGGIRYSKRFEALLPGEWSFTAGARGLHSYLGANTDSPGTWRDVHGHYLGENSVEDIFIGPNSAMKDNAVRGGKEAAAGVPVV